MEAFDYGDWVEGRRLLLPKEHFNRLKNIGYPLDAKDFFLVDKSFIESFDFIEHENINLAVTPDQTLM